MLYYMYESAIGPMQIIIEDKYITSISMKEEDFKSIKYINELNKKSNSLEEEILKETILQFEGYFNGTFKEFKLPLKYDFSPFMTRVYKTLETTEYGKTYTYQEIAKLAGSPRAARAVGTAMRKNQYAIVMPCHRVVRSNGEYGNFFNDNTLKEKLIKFEKENK